MFLYLTKLGSDFSRIWLLLTFTISFVLISVASSATSILMRKLIGVQSIILIGSNRTATDIIGLLDRDQKPKIVVSKHFSTINLAEELVSNYIEDKRNQQNEESIVEVWVTHDIYSEAGANVLENYFHSCSIRLVFIPELPHHTSNSLNEITYISGIPTIDSTLSDGNRINSIIKFLEDRVISFTALLLIWPFLLLIALIVKVDSKGPALYKQIRYGANGSEFRIYKFRTMTVLEKSDEFSQAKKNDPRITRVGRFLRASSIDELPQLINVLNGTMSLVGPRPLPKMLNEEYRLRINSFMKRHNVKPGITGLAQISGARGETPEISDMEKRINYDLEYIRNWSIWLDIEIMFKTIIHLLFPKNVY